MRTDLKPTRLAAALVAVLQMFLICDASASENDIKRLIADRLLEQAEMLEAQVNKGAELRRILRQGGRGNLKPTVNRRALSRDSYAISLKASLDNEVPIDFKGRGDARRGLPPPPFAQELDCLFQYVDRRNNRNAGIIRDVASAVRQISASKVKVRLEAMGGKLEQHLTIKEIPKICAVDTNSSFTPDQDKPLSLGWNARCFRTRAEGQPPGNLSRPTVAALLYDNGRTGQSAFCSGTLIAPNVVLTAAHCFCLTSSKQSRGVFYRTARSCRSGSFFRRGVRRRALDPRHHQIYLQHAGLFGVRKIIIHPRFNWTKFLPRADLALVVLDEPVRDIAAMPINDVARIRPGTFATGAGFGFHRPIRRDGIPEQTLRIVAQTGLKFDGAIRTGRCNYGALGRNLICWTDRRQFQGKSLGSTCKGDSGGPLFARHKSKQYLVGVTSAGGSRCRPGSRSLNTAVYPYRRWIETNVRQNQSRNPGADLSANARQVKCMYCPLCQKNLKVVGASNDGVNNTSEIEIQKGSVRSLRVSVNCSQGLGDSKLRLRLRDATRQAIGDCPIASSSGFLSCKVSARAGDRWQVELDGAQTSICQIVATTFDN